MKRTEIVDRIRAEAHKLLPWVQTILYGSEAKALKQSLASPKPLTELYRIANECELQLMAEVKTCGSHM